MEKKYLVYDCEIANCIPDGTRQPNLIYCDGWHDYEGMGISLIGAYLSWENTIKIYPAEALSEFQKAVNEADEIVGFNSKNFDDKLCKAHGVNIETTYDLLEEIRFASGQPRKYTSGETRAGYKLDNIAIANFGFGKNGSGAMAAILWQQKKQWDVANYLVNDVLLTTKLYKRILSGEPIIDPTDGSELKVEACDPIPF